MITTRRTLGFVAAAGGLAALEYGFRKSPFYGSAASFMRPRTRSADDEFRLDEGEGRKVPSFAFNLPDGTPRTLADYEGQGIVLNLWATWCPPCRMEMQSLDALASAVGWAGVVVLPISSDKGGAPAVRQLYTEQGLAYLPVLLDPNGNAGRALRERRLPTTVLIDKAGHERKRLVGSRTWNTPQAIEMVRQLIA